MPVPSIMARSSVKDDEVGEEGGYKALERQIGGSHYKDFVIQPVEFIHRNGIGFLEGNIIKYTCRHNKKNGKDDLLKAKHYIELLLELEYGE